MAPLAITAFTATTAVGPGNDALLDALHALRTGLAPDRYAETVVGTPLSTWTGRVSMPDGPEDCRSHRLAMHALAQDGFLDAAGAACTRHGAHRVALVVGTTTSTFEVSEAAYRTDDPEGALAIAPHLHHLHATTAFVRDAIGLRGPASTVSTACSSSAKAFAQAARMIHLGLVDAAVVGGIDTLTGSTLFGFRALGLVSAEPCRPFDARRDGISLGEGAGFALLERVDADTPADMPRLVGYGESADAFHMSAPHPEGLGARLAIDEALARAGVEAADVDYVNLHGTATPKNDAVEAALLADRFPDRVRASSTKGWTGHTLGAAGIVEAIVTLLALRAGLVPATLGSEGDAGSRIAFDPETRAMRIAASHAFAFGGNNCVLVFAQGR